MCGVALVVGHTRRCPPPPPSPQRRSAAAVTCVTHMYLCPAFSLMSSFIFITIHHRRHPGNGLDLAFNHRQPTAGRDGAGCLQGPFLSMRSSEGCILLYPAATIPSVWIFESSSQNTWVVIDRVFSDCGLQSTCNCFLEQLCGMSLDSRDRATPQRLDTTTAALRPL